MIFPRKSGHNEEPVSVLKLAAKNHIKEPSTFDWHYDEQEVCYFLEGEVTVKTSHETVSFGKGDLVTFPKV